MGTEVVTAKLMASLFVTYAYYFVGADRTCFRYCWNSPISFLVFLSFSEYCIVCCQRW